MGNLAFINKTINNIEYWHLCESISTVHSFYFTRILFSEMKVDLISEPIIVVKEVLFKLLGAKFS